MQGQVECTALWVWFVPVQNSALVNLFWFCQFSGLFSSVRIHFETQGHCVHPGTEATTNILYLFTNGELHPSVSALILRFLLMSVGQVGPLFWPFMFLDMLTCSMLHSDTCLPKQIKAISDYLNTSVLSASLCGILTGWKKNMLDTWKTCIAWL